MSETQQEPPAEEEERPFQFGLSTMFVITFIWAVLCAFAFTFGPLLVAFGAIVFSSCGAVHFYHRQRFVWLGGLLVVFFGSVLFVCTMLPARPVQPARVTSPRNVCLSHIRHVAMALTFYEADHGSFPPAYIADESGKPMHSWRVLLLPYLDRKDIYEHYNFDEPWDGPNNRKLHDIVMRVFHCASDESVWDTSNTSYVLVVGPGTMFPDDESLKVSDATDGESNTVMLVEVVNSGIHWMEPRDLHVVQMSPGLNPATGQGISSNHGNGANVGSVDGSVRFLNSKDFTPQQVDALLTRAGGEDVDIDEP